jgi:cell division protein FtsB
VLDLFILDSTLNELTEQNKKLRMRNDRLHAEVIDIKSRLSAIEAHARSELGLIKPGETFFQIIEK